MNPNRLWIAFGYGVIMTLASLLLQVQAPAIASVTMALGFMAWASQK